MGGQLGIWDNPTLQNLEGLGSLTNIGGPLSVNNNPQLCQSNVDDLIEQLNMSMDPDPYIQITNENRQCQ